MSYYILSEIRNAILGVWEREPTQEDLQRIANVEGEAVYIIAGKRLDKSAEPRTEDKATDEELKEINEWLDSLGI